MVLFQKCVRWFGYTRSWEPLVFMVFAKSYLSFFPFTETLVRKFVKYCQLCVLCNNRICRFYPSRFIYLFIYWNTVKGRQTASTHRKTIVSWLPHKAVKSCPYIQLKTIYSTTWHFTLLFNKTVE